MNQSGDETAWHVLERVSEGQEEIPELLGALMSPDSRHTAWETLEHRLLWWRSELVVALLPRLLEMLPHLGPEQVAGVLEQIANRARWHRLNSLQDAPGMRTVLIDGQRAATALLGNDSAEVRACAARAVEQVRDPDPAVLPALRAQALVEPVPVALGRQLLAAGEILAALGTPRPGTWFDQWTAHPDAHVALAARAGRLTAYGTPDRAGATLTTASLPPRTPDPATVAEAVRELRTWRRPADGAWETVVAALDCDDFATRQAASRAVASAGSSIAGHTDLLLTFVEQEGEVADCAARALAGVADLRVLPWYLKWSGTLLPTGDHLPGAWAPCLLPSLRVQLTGRRPENLLPLVTHWGPAAAASVPELLRLLDTPLARGAAVALGRIGPDAVDGAHLLADLATGVLRPPRLHRSKDREPKRWHGAQSAAWAHWQVTGDPTIALDVTAAAVRTQRGGPVLSHLADLGPIAVRHADAVRPLLDSLGPWTRLGAAEAWWRLTGDAAPAVDTLLPALHSLSEHRADPFLLRVVAVLGAIGEPAAAAAPRLTHVMRSERRYGGGILSDEALCRATRTALSAIVGGVPAP
ncbi:hypothetical protein ACQEVM_36540 [Streptomyces sp. CA-243310]|uniref:hypothetical protein n=1 Tax=Streptomyces sp. CA-243310 TaxID=3240056 RepID=UPI003D91FDF0